METIKRTLRSAVQVALVFGIVALLFSCEAGYHAAESPRVNKADSAQGYLSPGTTVEPSIRKAITPDFATQAAYTLNPGEELWVIARENQARVRQAADDDSPGSGALVIPPPDDDPERGLVPVPLKHTDVRAGIAGYIATVDVTQQFHNPYDSKIEAVYVFPLPQNAAVNGFVMTIGERRIRGVIREREEAERIYRDARAQGHTASLLTQERPNIFTQKVANIEPGKQIDVNIRYFHTLSYDDGWYEFVFPMVVGPRYNPAYSTDPIHARARGGNARTRSSDKSIEYLRPDERSGHDIDVNVEIQAGVTIEQIRSVNHRTNVERIDARRFKAQLAEGDRVPNKDFVLRYRVAGEKLKANLLAYRDGNEDEDGYFALMLYPPAELKSRHRRPMEMVFVVDCSGSMRGKPLDQAKVAMHQALDRLQPSDTFQIIRFSESASTLGKRPVLATRENLRKGRRFVDSLNAGGGTEMIKGIRASLSASSVNDDLDRQRVVTFMTDGYIGNENEILGEIHKRLGETRIFSFGVGSSPNRFLMDRMAILGRGAVTYLSLEDDARDIMDQFFGRIAHPALTDATIDWRGVQVADRYPQQLPDMFVGRATMVVGRYRGELPASIALRGEAGGDSITMDIPITHASGDAAMASIKPVWARMKIKDLATEQAARGGERFEQEILDIALEHRLVSAYTAFIAVDASRRTMGTHGATVHTPVPVPDGVEYETTVPEE